MKENEQVSFEQNQHIPTSLFEPMLQAMIPPLQWSSLVYIQIIFAPFTMVKTGTSKIYPFTMEDLFSKSSTFIQERYTPLQSSERK